MYKNTDYIYDATLKLEEFTGMPVEMHRQKKDDAILTFINTQFTVLAKPEVRVSNKGILLSDTNQLKQKSKRPVILIAKFIVAEIALELKRLKINYLDVAGNTYINEGNIYIYIRGQKVQKLPKTNQSRAFQEAGIRLIFNLLINPENLQLTYRELSKLTEVSIGSVSNVFKELEELNFILKTKTKKVLKNQNELLNRWIVAYNDVLRPRILKKRMRLKLEILNNWDRLPIQAIENVNLWGGEPAAALISGQLQPEKFTIYTNGSWQSIAREFKLTPDENGDIEILHLFWKEEPKYRQYYTVPLILIYADLISSGYERNIKIAKQILDNEVSMSK